MQALSTNNIAHAIYLSLKDKTEPEQLSALPNIVRFLARKRMVSKSESILLSLDKIINEEKGKIIAKISSRNRLSEKEKEEIGEMLKKRYSARAVYLEEKQDKSLLGGIKIEANGEVIDLTLKSKVLQLQKYLTRKV